MVLSILSDHSQAQGIVKREDPISKIQVSIEQKTIKSPIKIRVTNNNDKPITIIRGSSPLDGAVLTLGRFNILPEGASEPVKFPGGKPTSGRPDLNDLITIGPRQSQEQKIKFKNPRQPTDNPKEKKRCWTKHLGKRAEVHLYGKWEGVWLKTKVDVILQWERNWEKDIHRGDYKSNVIKTILY